MNRGWSCWEARKGGVLMMIRDLEGFDEGLVNGSGRKLNLYFYGLQEDWFVTRDVMEYEGKREEE